MTSKVLRISKPGKLILVIMWPADCLWVPILLALQLCLPVCSCWNVLISNGERPIRKNFSFDPLNELKPRRICIWFMFFWERTPLAQTVRTLVSIYILHLNLNELFCLLHIRKFLFKNLPYFPSEHSPCHQELSTWCTAFRKPCARTFWHDSTDFSEIQSISKVSDVN